MGRNLHRLGQRLPCYEDTEDGIGLRDNGEGRGFGVGLLLEGNQIVGVLLHLGQPIHNELVGLPSGQTKPGKGARQKGGGIGTGDAETAGEVIIGGAFAFPVEVVVGLAGVVGESAVGSGGDRPAVFIGGIGAGEYAVKV